MRWSNVGTTYPWCEVSGGAAGRGAEPTPTHTRQLFAGNYVVLLRYMSGCRGAVCRISLLGDGSDEAPPVGGTRSPSRGYTRHRETIRPGARAMCLISAV